MFASVIICAHNHLEDLTIPCLDHVLRGTPYPHELILIDDGSADGTIQYFQTLPAKTYHFPKRQGVTRARNAGLELAAGDPLVFLDNDVFVPRGWLRILAGESQKQNVGIVGGIPSNEKDRLNKELSFDGLIDFPSVGGACMAITRRCFDALGYLDESLVNCGEDTDYCYRAKFAGFRVCSTPRLVVQHLAGGTRRDLDPTEMNRASRRFRRKYAKYQRVLPMPPLYPF